MVDVQHQRITVQLGSDKEDAELLFVDGELLALLVFLEPANYVNDPYLAGKWSVEIGFGPCVVGSRTVLFETLEAGLAWAAEQYEQFDGQRIGPRSRAYSRSGTP